MTLQSLEEYLRKENLQRNGCSGRFLISIISCNLTNQLADLIVIYLSTQFFLGSLLIMLLHRLQIFLSVLTQIFQLEVFLHHLALEISIRTCSFQELLKDKLNSKGNMMIMTLLFHQQKSSIVVPIILTQVLCFTICQD